MRQRRRSASSGPLQWRTFRGFRRTSLDRLGAGTVQTTRKARNCREIWRFCQLLRILHGSLCSRSITTGRSDAAVRRRYPAMPIAFKEWAVTVRALAEGEQLVTLRKGGIREPNKHFEVEHERFFLYPTFDHQRSDLVRESHRPELRRALEEGVWADGEPVARTRTQRARAAAAGPRADPRLGRGRRAVHGDRPARRRRAFPVLRLDLRTTRRSGSSGSAAIRCTCCCCAPTGSRDR